MMMNYNLDEPLKNQKRKSTSNNKVTREEKQKEESYEDMLKREKREKHGREGVHIT
jgi:hypothetical protein